MAPEETPDVEVTDDAPVIVGDVDTAPDEVTNEGDTTVIVETPAETSGDAVEAVVVETAIDQSARIAALEAEIAALRGDVIDASITAEVAQSMAESALEADEAIIEAADEAIVETIENAEIEENNPLTDKDDEIVTDEIAPVSTRVHPWFRSMSDWRAGRN